MSKRSRRLKKPTEAPALPSDKAVAVPLPIYDALYKYLGTRPWAEVQEFMRIAGNLPVIDMPKPEQIEAPTEEAKKEG